MIFLICDIDDAARAGALVDSCRFVVLEVARRALGSVLDVGKRRRRMRGRFHRWMQIKTGPQQCAETYHDRIPLPPSERGPSAPVSSIVDENWTGVDIRYYPDGEWRRQSLV